MKLNVLAVFQDLTILILVIAVLYKEKHLMWRWVLTCLLCLMAGILAGRLGLLFHRS